VVVGEGFAHVPDEHSFHVTFRVKVGAAVEGFFGGVAEDFSSAEAFVFAELGKPSTDNADKRLSIQTSNSLVLMFYAKRRLKNTQIGLATFKPSSLTCMARGRFSALRGGYAVESRTANQSKSLKLSEGSGKYVEFLVLPERVGRLAISEDGNPLPL
jgi:hypothetical protein